MKPTSCILKSFLLTLLVVGITYAQQKKYEPTPENQKAREWFQEARFGLFIHWGVYSILGDGEWAMNQQEIPIRAYEKLPSFFNPTQYDPKEWVAMVKAAGMKYIVITSKHHDGFSMFDSKASDYTIVKKTPYAQDVLKMLADECHHQGIKIFFYYSQLDWHHPDYFPRGFTGGSWTGREEKGDMNRYLDYMDAQLSELLTNYGEVAGIWFDGMWDKRNADWKLERTYNLIHKLQPAALVGSNHHLKPFEGEDFQMFEKDLPGENTSGFSPDKKVGDLPKETCETINTSWGFKLTDFRNKSKKDLIQYLVKAAGHDANFLLNVGPMPNGKIQTEHVELLKQVGEWLTTNGETIYGTHGGPLAPRDWGVTTQKENKVFVHLLHWTDGSIVIPTWGKKIKTARLFQDKTAIKFSVTDYGIALKIPAEKMNDIDTVIELE